MLDFGFGLIDCILDWKVRGYCSKYAASPSKGYVLCRDGYKSEKPSRSHGTEHDNYLAYNHRGLTINAGYLEYSATSTRTSFASMAGCWVNSPATKTWWA